MRLRRRLIAVGLAITASLTMSGCWWDANWVGCFFFNDQEACDRFYEFGPGGPVPGDPERPYPTLASGFEITAAQKGTPYAATFSGTVRSQSRPRRGRRGRVTIRRLLVQGSFAGTGNPPPQLAAFRNGIWQGLMSATFNTRKRTMSIRGLALVTFTTGGQSCVRFTAKGVRRRGRGRRGTMRGTFKTLGGSGSASNLQANGSFRRSDAGVPSWTMRGRGTTKQGRAIPLGSKCSRVTRAFARP